MVRPDSEGVTGAQGAQEQGEHECSDGIGATLPILTGRRRFAARTFVKGQAR